MIDSLLKVHRNLVGKHMQTGVTSICESAFAGREVMAFNDGTAHIQPQ